MGRTMPDDCTRCGGVVDWGDFGPDEDGTVGTTCTCPPPPDLAAELALVLDLLDRYLPRLSCHLTTTGKEKWRDELGQLHPVPLGSCWAHRQYDGAPCRIGQGQQLLQRHGLRP